MNFNYETTAAALIDHGFLVALTICIGGLIAGTAHMRTSRQSKKTVRYASAGWREIVREITGTNCPWFLLRLSREAQKAGRTCYRIGGLYFVSDPELQRNIFLDPATDKSLPMYKPLGNITGSFENIFSSINNGHWKMVRKSTAHAFAKPQVQRMREIAIKYANDWWKTIHLIRHMRCRN